MSVDYEIKAEPRQAVGTSASRRYRHEGKVPVVIYGAGKDNLALLVNHDELSHNLDTEGFHSAVIKIDTGSGVEQAILRDVQMHPSKPKVMHVDFQRVSATEKIHIAVPLHFIGAEDAPGVKTDNGIMSHVVTDVDVECLPADLPEYLEVDVSSLGMHESAHLSDIQLPDGVVITSLAHGGEDLAVATVIAPQLDTTEEVEEAEPGEEAEAASEQETPSAEEGD